MEGQRKKFVLGLVFIVLLALVAIKGMSGSMAAYQNSYETVKSQPGRVFQVPGVVDKSVAEQVDRQAGSFQFTMRDVETRAQSMVVRSKRIKPGNFDTATQVVCIGRYKDGVFEADNILVKCPSKEQEKLKAAGG
ncbi:MAG: cytochrome c maturation protein CcmE [Armatimonadetes bacterium]|nr:cytochrome c maturation protein CcmE [Armatimonadota bacterium]